MRVLYTGTLGVSSGGFAFTIYSLMKGLRGQNVYVELFMPKLKGNDQLIGNDVPVYMASAPIDDFFQYSFSHKKKMIAMDDFDIYHAHGIWQYLTYALINIANKKRKPYVVTPHGMLYPQDIKRSNKYLKFISLKIRLLNDLNKAACVHVTNEEEMICCRNLGVISPIAVIPNPIEVKDYPSLKKDGIFRVGYLGRLHPRKKVEKLISAFAEISSNKRIELVIIGADDPQYEVFLKNEVRKLGLTNVRFTGFLTGETKEKELNLLSLLVLPSDFENFGNVIIEGLIRGIPCVATKGAPWKELNDYSCGWWIDNDLKSIKRALSEAIDMDEQELKQMGERGKILVKKSYTSKSVASKIKQLYTWILNEGDKPDFVY